MANEENLTAKGAFKTGLSDPVEAQKKGVEAKRKKKSISQALSAWLETKHEDTNERGEIEQVEGFEILAAKLLEKAKNKDLTAIDMILDRTEGKPKQFIQVNSSDEIFDSEDMTKIKTERGLIPKNEPKNGSDVKNEVAPQAGDSEKSVTNE